MLNVILLVMLSLFDVSICDDDVTVKKNVDAKVTGLNLYKNLFKVKRKDHLAIVQKLILVDDVAKLASFVDASLSKIIEVSKCQS